MSLEEDHLDSMPTPAGLLMRRLRRWRSLEGALQYAARITQTIHRLDAMKEGDKYPFVPLFGEGIDEPYDKVCSELSRLTTEIVRGRAKGLPEEETRKHEYRISDIKSRLSMDSWKMVKGIVDAGYSSVVHAVYSGEHGDDFRAADDLEPKLASYREAFTVAEQHIRNMGSGVPVSARVAPDFDERVRTMKWSDRLYAFSPREWELLKALMKAHEAGKPLRPGKRFKSYQISKLKHKLPSPSWIQGDKVNGWVLGSEFQT